MDAEFFFNDLILPQKPCPFNCKNHRLTGVFCANSFALIDLCQYFVCQFLQQPQTPRLYLCIRLRFFMTHLSVSEPSDLCYNGVG